MVSVSVEDVVWTRTNGVSVVGNSLTKTGPTTWGNAGGASTRAIISGDGYLEWTATETTTYRICGLSYGDTDWNFTDIDFGMFARPSGALWRIENGAMLGIGTYITGDVLRVEVSAGTVYYKKNGALLSTSLNVPTFPLLADSSLYDNGSTITDAVLSGENLGAAVY
jgi:hypothetical protein